METLAGTYVRGKSGTIASNDSPQELVPQYLERDDGTKSNHEHRLLKANLIFNFQTYVAARTDDPELESNVVYTGLAEGDWTFNGSMQWDAKAKGFGDYVPMPTAGVQPPGSNVWTIKDGVALTYSTMTVANKAMDKEVWK